MYMFAHIRGLRSGTLPTPLVVGLGAACEVAMDEMERDTKWIKFLSGMASFPPLSPPLIPSPL